jgi:NarL family two-component system response regulator LiaR
MSRPIRILIAEDHALVRDGLRSLLMTEDGMEVIGEASSGVEAVERYAALQPDIVLMDLIMPELDGIEATKQIVDRFPEARVLALTSFSDDDKVLRAIRAGALGYILKDSSSRELLQALRHLYQGEASLDPAVALTLIRTVKDSQQASPAPEATLSEREVEVLRLVAEGLSNQEIADKLSLSERTARNHVGNILSKLHLANRTQAALYALRHGIVARR